MQPTLTPVVDLRGTIEDRELIAFAVGPHEEAILLVAGRSAAAVAFGRHDQPEWASFPDSRAARSYEALLVVIQGHDVSVRALRDLTATFPIVQPLPGGETVVVGSRAARDEEGHERNASVYDEDGLLVREFLLGDGIQDVQATEDGKIWVSYFDEGVYGNFGWGDPGGPSPIGASGLIRFDRAGAIEWEFDPPANVEPIDDCYALNVSDGTAWAYYYASFTLARVHEETVTAWDTPVAGARAIAVRDDTVWLVGGYPADETRCVVCRFADDQIVEQRRFRLATHSGDVARDVPIAARGGSVYAISEGVLHRLTDPSA